jgi:peptidoglycan LD-endopeptidase LytH
MFSLLKKIGWLALLIIFTGYLLPNRVTSPISITNITRIDPESFWYYPWGASGVHRGIDIFCEKGTAILSPVSGFIIRKDYGSIAGNYIYLIGPKWRKYYFAHMDTTYVHAFAYIKKGELIGKTGNTGNAANKPTHLHYSIETIFPYFWLYDSKAMLGWQKTFYIDPIKELNF